MIPAVDKELYAMVGKPVMPVNGLPLLGNSFAAVSDPLGFMATVRSEYKDVVSIKLAGKKYIIVQSPEACRHVLQENAKNYYKPGLAKLMKRFLGDGLATSNGALWLQQRRLMQPAFHRKKIEALVATINEETNTLVHNWHKKSGSIIAVSEDMLQLTLDNIARAMFGKDIRKDIPEVYDIINEMLAAAAAAVTALIKFPLYRPTPNNRRLLKANRRFEKIIDDIIDKRLQNESVTGDLLDLLLHAHDAANGIGRRQLKDEILTIFIAGHETTAQTLSWVLYQLALYPASYKKLRKEAAAVDEKNITLETLQQLTSTKAVIEETMRVYPPVWVIARQSHKDDTVAGYHVPAGATILVNIYGMNYHSGYWPSPTAFMPARFEGEGQQQDRAFLYMPFGGGQRFCIGHAFAMMVMQTILCRLVKEFSFELAGNTKPVAVPAITLRAKGGIHLRVQSFTTL